MSESTVDGATEYDPFNSLPESPNAEEVPFTWKFQGKLVDSSLIVAMIHFFFGS